MKKSGGPVNIERKGLVKTLDQWGPEFKIRFDIKLKQDLPKSWLNFLHLTTGENCCGGGSRLPGIWFRNANVKGKFGNTMMVATSFQKNRKQRRMHTSEDQLESPALQTVGNTLSHPGQT